MSYCGDMTNDNTLKELFGDKRLIDPETGVVDRDSPEFIELLKITPRPVFDELRRLAHLWKEQREREIRRSKELAESRTEITLRDNRRQELEAQAAALREALMSAAYYYEPATKVLAENDAGAVLLKRLELAETVCKAFHRWDVFSEHAELGDLDDAATAREIWTDELAPALLAWHKAGGNR